MQYRLTKLYGFEVKTPVVLLNGEEDAIEASYLSLHDHQEKEDVIEMKPEKIILLSWYNKTQLMDIYDEDPQISGQKLKVYFVDDHGSRDGVVPEMFCFLGQIFMLNYEGSSQFTFTVNPTLQPQDYVTIGHILTHGFVLCGVFPVQPDT